MKAREVKHLRNDNPQECCFCSVMTHMLTLVEVDWKSFSDFGTPNLGCLIFYQSVQSTVRHLADLLVLWSISQTQVAKKDLPTHLIGS